MKTFPIEFLLVNKRSSHLQGVILVSNFSSNRWREIVLFWGKDNNLWLVRHLLNPGLRVRFYGAPPPVALLTARYGAISDFHPPKWRIYARAPAHISEHDWGWCFWRDTRVTVPKVPVCSNPSTLFRPSLFLIFYRPLFLPIHPLSTYQPLPLLSLFFFSLSLSPFSHYDPIGSTCLPRTPLPFIPKPSSSVSTLDYVQLLPLFSSLS